MTEGLAVGGGRRVRRFRSVSEKIEIVQLTLKPGASVAEVARAHGINVNQLFPDAAFFADRFRSELPPGASLVRRPDFPHQGNGARQVARSAEVREARQRRFD